MQPKAVDLVNVVFNAIKSASYGKLTGDDRAFKSGLVHQILSPVKLAAIGEVDMYLRQLKAAEDAASLAASAKEGLDQAITESLCATTALKQGE